MKQDKLEMVELRPRVISSIALLALTAFLVLTMPGCAYFNTFYNAQRYYKQGLEKEQLNTGSGKADFKSSLEKAVTVAREYQDSRWIDDAFFLIAMNYYWMGTYDKARAQFEGFLEHFPKSPFAEEAKYYYALTLIELKQYSEGRVVLQEMFGSKKFGRDARLKWAEAFKIEKNWDAARKAFRDLLGRYPHGETAHAARLQLAEIELAGGDTLSAIKTYERYLSRAATSKENYERMLTLAELYYREHEYGQARRTLKKTKGRYSDIDEKCNLLTAKIKVAQGDTLKAEKLLANISNVECKAEAFFILASLYELEGKYELSMAYYDTVIRERRSDYAGLAERKRTLLEARIVKPDSTATLKIDPAEQQFRLAEAYFLSFGDFQRALDEYNKVVTDYPESIYAPKALYGIAWLKHYRLNDTLWRGYFEELISRYPESEEAKEALNLLQDEAIPSKDS